LSVRWRAADADDRENADGKPRAAPAGRTVRGAGAARRGSPAGADRTAQVPRAHDPARRAERRLLAEPRRPRLRAREGSYPLRGQRARVSREWLDPPAVSGALTQGARSEEHTSELQSR